MSPRIASSKERVEGHGGSNWAPTAFARVREAEVTGTTSSLPAHTTRERSPGWLVVAVDVRVHPRKFLVADGVP